MPLTQNIPKNLLDLGDGRALLDMQLESLAACGLTTLRIVTGYRTHQVEAKLAEWSGFNFEIVYNPFYRLSNNLVSAWLGLRDLTGPALLINGDDLYTPQLPKALLKSPHDITMLISRKPQYDADDMKISTRGGCVVNIGKELTPGEADGESIGMMLFQGAGLLAMQQCLERMVREDDSLQLFYLAALRRLIHEGYAVHFLECSPEDWAEIDYPPDILKAQLRFRARQPL